MASRRYSRFRHALRLVASAFLLSTPCHGGWEPAPPGSCVARTAPDGATDLPSLACDPRVFAGASHPVR